MSKEDRRQYIFAQLGSLPNAIQYVEVTKYIEDLEQQVKKQQQVIDKLSKIIYEIDDLRKTTGGYPSYYLDELCDILKEVSE